MLFSFLGVFGLHQAREVWIGREMGK